MPNQTDSPDGKPKNDPGRPSPSLVETTGDLSPRPSQRGPAPGSDEARNEERKTPPSRNRGVTDI